ncbi:MAG: DUF2442 domain-containing protein [Cyanobacteria bacterium J06643_4]
MENASFMQCPRIIDAKIIDRYMMVVHFSNQESKVYDVRPLLEKEMFAPLRNIGFFRNFKIESGGYALVWNEEIDISEYELWKNGIPAHKEDGNVHKLFEKYAEKADSDKFDAVLARMPNVLPIEGDEI